MQHGHLDGRSDDDWWLALHPVSPGGESNPEFLRHKENDKSRLNKLNHICNFLALCFDVGFVVTKKSKKLLKLKKVI